MCLAEHAQVNGTLYMGSYGGLLRHKLGGKCGEEPGGLATVAVAPLEEEAGGKVSVVEEGSGDGTGDGGLSGASHALEPEDGLGMRILGPFVYLGEQFKAGLGMALIAVSLGVGVECGAIGDWQLVEGAFLIGVEDEGAGQGFR